MKNPKIFFCILIVWFCWSVQGICEGPLTLEKIAFQRWPIDYSLSGDGKKIAFSQETPDGVNLFMMPAFGGFPTPLTVGENEYHCISFSPDGKRIAAINSGDLVILNLSGGITGRARHQKARSVKPVWTKDGEKVAFVSRERGFNQIWLTYMNDLETRQVVKEPMECYSPAISGDGKTFFFMAFDSASYTQSFIYKVSSLKDRNFSSIATAAQFFGRNFDYPACSPVSDEFACISDIDGWDQLWLYGSRGRMIRKLTSDPSDKSMPVWSPNGEMIAFLAISEGRFNVRIFDVKSGKSFQINTEDGGYKILGWARTAGPAGRASLLVVYESYNQTPVLKAIDVEKKREQRISATLSSLESGDFIKPQRVSFKSGDGLTINGWLYIPKVRKEKCPGIIYVHGGPNFQFELDWNPFYPYLAQEGYVVLCPDFRGSTGYGKAFRDANIGQIGKMDLDDVMRGVDFLKSMPFVDSSKIGIFGKSYGAFLTYLAIEKFPEVFRCASAWYGDSDLGESLKSDDWEGSRELIGMFGTPQTNPKGFFESSPINFVSRIQAPLLIIQGRADIIVHPRMTELMEAELKRNEKLFEIKYYENEGHGFENPKNLLDALERTFKFFERHLKRVEPINDVSP